MSELDSAERPRLAHNFANIGSDDYYRVDDY